MKKIAFSGYDWIVREDTGNPGPNSFSGENVWVDDNGNLHLKVSCSGNFWKCAEVYLDKPLGHGKYSFEFKKNMFMDKHVILGLFTYQDDTKEIDIEFGRWGMPLNFNGQFVAQPSDFMSVKKFLSLSTNIKASFDWQENSINFECDCFPFGKKWTYKGVNVPPSEGKEKVHLNLWVFNNKKPGNEEVIIKSFRFE